MAIKKEDLSMETNFEQFCENWINHINAKMSCSIDEIYFVLQ
jgi:hypothetical protein